jgi:hypothetical protein
MNREILCRPFGPEQIRQRKGRAGGTLSYVETHAIIARLNEGCDRWDFEIAEHSVHDNEVIVLGKLTADGVVKTAFGGAAVTIDSQNRVVSIADDLKAAASDALKKAASLLGVGLELYGGACKAKPLDGPQADRSSADTAAREAAIADRVTARQLGAIHGSCRRLGVDHDDLIGLVHERFGKSKVEHLTKAEASEVIDHFHAEAPART